MALASMWFTMGVVLMHRDVPSRHERGLALLAQVRDLCLNGRDHLFVLGALDCTPQGRGLRAVTAMER